LYMKMLAGKWMWNGGRLGTALIFIVFLRYECVCVPGTAGRNCEININECDSNPCKNGNCNDGVS
jgi:hypothetical protein